MAVYKSPLPLPRPTKPATAARAAPNSPKTGRRQPTQGTPLESADRCGGRERASHTRAAGIDVLTHLSVSRSPGKQDTTIKAAFTDQVSDWPGIVFRDISVDARCIVKSGATCTYASDPTPPYRTVPYRTVPYRTVPYRTVPSMP